jgi:FMN-dependent oxidoreductase (nitrilotriacetate monooxygenase family)
LDHICGGRFGWNIVTSTENGAAQNFGLDEIPLKANRYEIADEYLDLVGQLFSAWDPDAIIVDRERKIYADGSKVRPVNFTGKYFKSRGPLNTAPSPQGRPAYFQAGASPVGRAFGAKHADCVIVAPRDVAGMIAFREDIHVKAVAAGRSPKDVKVFYLLSPVLGETTSEAQAKAERMRSDPYLTERKLAFVSSISNIDFSKFDLDKPVPPLTTEGGSGALEKVVPPGSPKTLRELLRDGVGESVELVGTSDEVADKMVAIAEEVGGDGFLFTAPTQQVSRQYILELTEGLAPALQKRGLMRTTPPPGTLRHRLQAGP